VKITAKSSILKHSPASHGGRNSKNLGLDVLDFSSNTSPLGCPKSVKGYLKANITKIEEYPDLNSDLLLSSLKEHTKFEKSNIVVGNGAAELIYNFCSAFISKNSKVLIAVPTFQEYESACSLNGASPSFFKSMNLSQDLSSFLPKIPKKGFVFICNPNNPTGTILSRQQMNGIIGAAKRLSTIVFADECFIEMVPRSDESVMGDVKKFDNLFVLRSLTKSFGLPGIRIGYAISSGKIISIMKKIRVPWSVNSLAQDAGIAALSNTSHLAKSKKLILQEGTFLQKKINNIDGFYCHDSATTFLLVKTKACSTRLQNELLKKKILIRDCKDFRGLNGNFIRIAVKSHQENLKLVAALEGLK